MTTPAEMNALRDRFDGVAQTLGEQLAAASPRFVTLAAKWSRDDLIPGLSDMDFRIVCDEQTTAEDWVQLDRQLGCIHRQMVADHPEWNRINEHTAGAGVSLAEFRTDRFHHPEYAVWTAWWGPGDRIAEIRARTLARPLAAVDEHYHLSRFLAYYSPYIHGIDPPINLGDMEPKYALHSRCWHYYAPPMLSAATLLARRHFAGKREGLLWLAENGFATQQTLAVLKQVDAHYNTPELGDPKLQATLETFLFTAFEELLDPVCDAVQSFELPRPASKGRLKEQLAGTFPDPLVELLDHVRYAHIRAGRYFFYLNAPPHFSAARQLVSEQSWTRKLVTTISKSLQLLQDESDLPLADCVSTQGVEHTAREREALRSMKHLAELPSEVDMLRAAYAQAIEWYPDFYRPIERACQHALVSEYRMSTRDAGPNRQAGARVLRSANIDR